MATNNAINSTFPVTTLSIAQGGTNASSLTDTHGTLTYNGTSVATVAPSTAGYVLTSNGAGSAPTFQTQTGSGCTTFTCGTGSASISGTTITIAGTSNQITTSGSGSTVTIAIPSSPSLSGTLTVASGVTVTSGNATVSAGNLALPTTSSTVGQVTINSLRALCMLGTRSFQAGNAANTTGSFTDDVYIGDGAASAATTTSCNVIIGSGAGKGTGMTNNVIIGYQAMSNASLTSANNNTVIGYQAGNALTNAPKYNVLIGRGAGSSYTNGESSNICIMNSGTAGESNVCRIGTDGSGDGQINKTYIAGIYGVTVSGGTAVYIKSDGQLGTSTSSARFKTDIKELGDTTAIIKKLRPVTFQYKKDPTPYPQYGLIAEEVHEVVPELVSYDLSGDPYTVKYEQLPILLLNEIQKQYQVLDALTERLARLQERTYRGNEQCD